MMIINWPASGCCQPVTAIEGSAVITFIFATNITASKFIANHLRLWWLLCRRGIVSLQFIFLYQAFGLLRTLDRAARKLMFGSFYYLPVVQLMFLFDFIGKVK
jgi:protoheme IX farnesyltransferase